jgi:nucleotide-binding universal stress UspA family protein
MNHLLIALDFSQFSRLVEKVGYAMAKKLNATVTLVTIVNKFIDYEPIVTGQVFTDNWEARQYLANENLAKVNLAHPDIETNVVSFIGDPQEDIIDLAIKNHAKFIVIGTHGRTGFTNFLLGSTAEYIIKHSTIPVMVVPYKMESH